jgi:ADP-ribosyl-[dinitrogen reductase] hydrolase
VFDRRGESSRDAVRGCLLGGAVGDALGAPVEFMKLSEIRARFGPDGVRELEPEYGRRGAITDDTQMTLFTAEALIRAHHRWQERGIVSVAEVAHRAYLRWLSTQGSRAETSGAGRTDASGGDARADPSAESGWLLGVPDLHARRGPGRTCLSALESGGMGTPDRPINESKGCGGVMRVAPVGLARFDDPFTIGCELAAVTHGHPTGYLAAGYLAQVLADVARGAEVGQAAYGALGRLARERRHEETTAAVRAALARAEEGDPSPEGVESLGAGWIAEEALAIGLYCALVARDFEHGVLLAVNHGGDSDSTASIAGNLMGLVVGESGIPSRWRDSLELREVIAAVADDLWMHFGAEAPPRCEDLERYPPG